MYIYNNIYIYIRILSQKRHVYIYIYVYILAQKPSKNQIKLVF